MSQLTFQKSNLCVGWATSTCHTIFITSYQLVVPEIIAYLIQIFLLQWWQWRQYYPHGMIPPLLVQSVSESVSQSEAEVTSIFNDVTGL